MPRNSLLCLVLFVSGALVWRVDAEEKPFAIQVVDEATGSGVPLVELETMDRQTYVTDSAGRVAFSEPGQMGVPVWFSLRSHGYEFPTDGFGMTGVRLTTQSGGQAVIKAKRLNIAERLVRLTGLGIYRDSVRLGEKVPLAEPVSCGGVAGQDTVQVATYRGRLFWVWGDTMRLAYPLGNFRATGAWSDLPARGGLPPEQGIDYHYLTDPSGFARAMCPYPEQPDGLIWLEGMVTVPDATGRERLVARYQRRRGLEKIHEHGFAVFNDEKEIFEPVKTLPLEEKWRFLRTQPAHGHDKYGDWLYIGEASSNVRVPARFEAVLDPTQYESWTCVDGSGQRLKKDGRLDYAWRKDGTPIESPEEAKWVRQGTITAAECRITPEDVATGQRVTLHVGTVRWNAYRQRWVLIAVQTGGKPSFLGEVWYAEAQAPTGPWRRAVKILTHDRYSFYNPVQHEFFDEDGGRRIYFEGTYTSTFSGNEQRTPHYDYNQMLYRLDLSDPRLKAAQE